MATQAYLTGMQSSGKICGIPVYQHLQTKMGVFVARNDAEIERIENMNSFKKGSIKRMDTENLPAPDRKLFEGSGDMKTFLNKPAKFIPCIFDTFLAKKDFEGVELIPEEGRERIKKYIRDTIAFYMQEKPDEVKKESTEVPVDLEGEETLGEETELGVTNIPDEIKVVNEPPKIQHSKFNLDKFKKSDNEEKK